MSFARKTTALTVIAALLAGSAIAVAQEPADDMEGDAPAIETMTDEGGDAEMSEGREDRGGMRGPGRRAERMLNRLDSDGSGDISVEEFGERRLSFLRDADEDGDGVISMEELTAAIDQRRQERREARLLNRFDIDSDGEITIEELERHSEKRFALIDRDDDGVVTAEEFRRHGSMGGARGHHGGKGPGHHRMGWHGR